MAKKDDVGDFDFGYNVKPKKAPRIGPSRKSTKADRQAYAIARRKGGELYGRREYS